MNNTNLEALERAVAVAEGLQPDVGYDVLLAAAKRFIRASRGPQPCPTCGTYFQGPHFCPGRTLKDIAYPGGSGRPWRDFLSGPGGVEYYYNQPTSTVGGQGGTLQHASALQAQHVEAKING